MGELTVTRVPTAENPADLCVKGMPGGQKKDNIIRMILWDIVE